MRRVPLWLALAVTGVATFSVGTALDASAADPSIPVELTASGDSDIIAELVDWQDTMFGAAQPTDISYFERGTTISRNRLLDGSNDFVIGGVPFTAAELAAHPDKASKIIEVPLTIGSTAIVLTEPLVGWTTRVLPTDPSCGTEDEIPELCIAIDAPFTDPIRLPPETLSAYITGLSNGFRQNNLLAWNGPALVDSMGVDNLLIQYNVSRFDTFVNRTEGTAQNKYLMEYAKELGPTAWELRKQEYSSFAWEPVGEVFPPRTLSVAGSSSQQGIIALSVDALSRSTPDTWAGNMGPIATTLVKSFDRSYPNSQVRVAEIQNANGDWVAPTRATLDAALEAGGDTPNYATFNKVPNAYPLVFVNRLYTVGGTLSPDKANSLAASIRYMVTDGQQLVVDDGGTVLTPSLRADALAKADQIVEANCTTDGYEVTTGGPSDFEPSTPQVRALTTMKHCTPEPPPATTTTVAESTTTTTAAPTTTESATTTTQSPILPADPTTGSNPVVAQTVPSPVVTSPRTPVVTLPSGPPTSEETVEEQSTESSLSTTDPPPSVESEAVAPSTTGESAGATGGGAGTRVRGIALARLPLDGPSDGSGGFKKLGTLMMGAAMFILGRRLYTARVAP